MESTPGATRIRETLVVKLGATHVSVIDHSAAHAGHPGAEGGGHYEVLVVSDRFLGLSRVAAQRLVYEALGEMMATEIHALSMRTMTPHQWLEHTNQGSP